MSLSKQTYRPAGRIVTRRIGEDHLLVPVSGGVAAQNAVFPLNRTGIFVWERLTGGKTMGETAREMAEVFAVGLDAGLADCESMAQRLVDEKLLEAVPA